MMRAICWWWLKSLINGCFFCFLVLFTEYFCGLFCIQFCFVSCREYLIGWHKPSLRSPTQWNIRVTTALIYLTDPLFNETSLLLMSPCKWMPLWRPPCASICLTSPLTQGAVGTPPMISQPGAGVVPGAPISACLPRPSVTLEHPVLSVLWCRLMLYFRL